MRTIGLVSVSDPRHTKQAVQTLSKAIELLLGVCGSQALVSLMSI